MDDSLLCVASPTGNVPVCDYHNGMSVCGMYLYGWCENCAEDWHHSPVERDFTAKWALFREV
jgi:hypothetical protein